MIQRLQSLWLLAASACAFLSFKVPFYGGYDQARYIPVTALTGNIVLMVTSVIGGAALIAIFLYKDRKVQFRITLITLLLSILNIVLYFIEIEKFAQGNLALTSVVTFAIPVFIFLAVRGIRKDEKLVKSLDRLR
jgi:membrane-bound ClpP family serine protease